MTAGRISREVWWKNREYFAVDIIPSWFSMPVYHQGDEK
jgi:hypothetical protein